MERKKSNMDVEAEGAVEKKEWMEKKCMWIDRLK